MSPLVQILRRWLPFSLAILLYPLVFNLFGAHKGLELREDFPLVTNVTQLRQAAGRNMGCLCSFSLEGVVLATDRISGTIFFQDPSGTELLETKSAGQPLQPGQRIRLQGTNYVTATQFGVSLGQRAVVDNDGRHSESECTATLLLRAGLYPIQVQWFNHTGSGLLNVSFSGPGFTRHPIAAPSLFRAILSPDGSIQLTNGLVYHCYEGVWDKLPDFQSLVPVRAGVASNFDLTVGSRIENEGLVFDGFLQVPSEGLYTFYLVSDDGSQLFLHNTPTELTVLGEGAVPEPRTIGIRQTLPGEQGTLWAQVEGKLTFVGKRRQGIELQLTSEETHMRIAVCDTLSDPPEYLLGSRVRGQGACLPTFDAEGHRLVDLLVIPNCQSLQVLEASPKPWSDAESLINITNPLPLLRTAAQVVQLRGAEANRGYKAKIKGVVVWVGERPESIVLQDSTGGVFVRLRPGWIWESTRVGEILEIEGTCIAGDFAPVVVLSKAERMGMGVLPLPIHPTWDQLIGGSVDSQYIELRAFVTEAHDHHLVLLLPGGKLDTECYPNPVDSMESLSNSVVTIKCCVFAIWDEKTHQVTLNHPLWLGGLTVGVDIPPPLDTFLADRRRARELTQYDVQRNIFKRVLVSGQVLHGSAGLYYLSDEASGLRFELVQPGQFEPGDLVEVAGLVELGGASPLLRQAVARKTGYSALPAPLHLSLEKPQLPSDSTRVWVEALLVGEKDTKEERVLEMRVGMKNFVTRLSATNAAASRWPSGSLLKLTGLLSNVGGKPQGNGVNAFELLLNSPADIELISLPPWWTLNRLLGAVTLLVVGLVLAFLWVTLLRRQVEVRTVELQREISERERAEQGRAIEQERTRIARDLHDDLGSNLTEISMLALTASEIELKQEESKVCLQQIAEKSCSMVTALDELVWAVNPKNDTIASLAEYLASFSDEFFSRTQIDFQMELPSEYPTRIVAAERRHHILLAVKELFNNAVRHGKPTKVSMRLSFLGDQFEIAIHDNGLGFDLTQPPKGNGLSNFQERMRELNGQCEVQSTPGKGTSVVFRLAL